CGDFPDTEPQFAVISGSQGAVLAGAAKVEMAPALPIVVAGYGPPRPDATEQKTKLYARATVVQVEAVRLAVVSLDLLEIPGSLSAEVRARVEKLQLTDVWLV